MRLGADVHREGAGVEVLVGSPAGRDLRRERRRRPGVHDVGFAHEAAGLAALRLVVAGGDVGRRVDRELILGRDHRLVPDRLARCVERVPERDRDAEEALTADQPVTVEAFDPGGVAGLHIARDPVHLVATIDERLTQVVVAAAISDVPLARADDLERLVSLFEELDGVGDRSRVAVHLARFGEHRSDLVLGVFRAKTGEALVGLGGGALRNPVGCFGCELAIALDDRADRQVEFAPPGDVGGVAEGADHGDAGAFVGLGKFVCDDGDFNAEQRGGHGAAEVGLVALVVGMGDEGDTRRDEFGAGGVDPDVGGVADTGEAELVVGARHLLVLELGLGDGGLEGDVPQRRRLDLVRLTGVQVVEERQLADAPAVVVDRLVGAGPVDRQPEATEQPLEGLLILDRELDAQFDEVGPADGDGRALADGFRVAGIVGGGEVGVVGQRRVAADTEVVLNTPFGGQAVVVPSHRVEDLAAGHALIPGDRVGVGVAEDVADVE